MNELDIMAVIPTLIPLEPYKNTHLQKFRKTINQNITLNSVKIFIIMLRYPTERSSHTKQSIIVG